MILNAIFREFLFVFFFKFYILTSTLQNKSLLFAHKSNKFCILIFYYHYFCVISFLWFEIKNYALNNFIEHFKPFKRVLMLKIKNLNFVKNFLVLAIYFQFMWLLSNFAVFTLKTCVVGVWCYNRFSIFIHFLITFIAHNLLNLYYKHAIDGVQPRDATTAGPNCASCQF